MTIKSNSYKNHNISNHSSLREFTKETSLRLFCVAIRGNPNETLGQKMDCHESANADSRNDGKNPPPSPLRRGRGNFEIPTCKRRGNYIVLPTKNGVAHQKSPSPCGRDLGRGELGCCPPKANFGLLKKLRYACFATHLKSKIPNARNDESLRILRF